MGCTYTKQQSPPLIPCKTVNGILKVSIQEAKIYKRSRISSMDPYLRLAMSNQEFSGYIHKKAGRSNLFNESFEFVINSCFKPEGRSMTVELWNKHVIGDRVLGMSIIDLDPIIGFGENLMMGSKLVTGNQENPPFLMMEDDEPKQIMRKTYCRMKVFLNHGVEEVGYLNTVFEFIEEPITTIGLKFIYASLRRTSTIFTTMYCSVQAIVGEEILRTHKQKDQDTKNPPSWQDETLMFNVPKSLKDCVIRVLDGEEEVGRLRFSLGEVMGKKGEYYFTEQLEHGSAISGVIKFGVLVGVDAGMPGSRKGSRSRMEQSFLKTEPNEQPVQMKREAAVQEQMFIEMKRDLPSQKSTKMQESEFRTVENTPPNEQEPSREAMRELVRQPLKFHKLEESNIAVRREQVKV